MKKSKDPRHKHRQTLLKSLFAFSFRTTPPGEDIAPIIHDLPEIDKSIAASAPEWPISQINRVDLSILRLAIFELKTSDTPPKVIIDEAVELGKEFGSDSSAKFVNGVLGHILKQLKPESSDKK